MSEKKRKRAEEVGGPPKKKVAFLPSGKVQVEHVENNATLGLLLASTPGLNFPQEIALKPYRNTKLRPPTTTSGPTSTTELLLQSSEHPRLDYLAREEQDGSSETYLKDYIAVIDPAIGKLQIIPVKRVTVRSTLRSETEEMREQQAQREVRQETMMAKRYALASEFGSRKSKKALEARTANEIRTNNANTGVADTVLQSMAALTEAMPTKEELAVAADEKKPRPTPNLAAEYPGDVYSIETIVGTEFMTMLEVKDWVDAAEAGEGVSVASMYVAKRIVKLAKNKQIQKLKVLRFILLCINFNAALMGSRGKYAKKVPPQAKLETAMGEDTPAGCVLAIRRKFTSDRGDMPRWNIDNLMTHVAAAALVVDDFEVDVHDLREDLKIDNKQIRQYFLELGCKVLLPNQTERDKGKFTKAESVNHFMARLKLPLSFPKVSAPRPKRK